MRPLKRVPGDRVHWPIDRPVNLGETLRVRWWVPAGTTPDHCASWLERFERVAADDASRVTARIDLPVLDVAGGVDDELEVLVSIPVDAVPTIDVDGAKVTWALSLRRPDAPVTVIAVTVAAVLSPRVYEVG